MKTFAIFLVLGLASLAAAQSRTKPVAAKKPVTAAQPTQAQLDAVPRISVDELKQLLKTDKYVVPVDARAPGAWNSGTTMMPGAVRVPPMEAAEHLGQLKKFKNRQIVTYCT